MRRVESAWLVVVLSVGCGSDGDDDDVAGGTDAGSAGDAAVVDAYYGDFPRPVPDECITDVGAGDHKFDCDGVTFDVMMPEACLTRACGVIMDVHGYTMDGRMQDNNTTLRALGGERGYIVVQPNANPAPPSASWSVEDDEILFSFLLRVAAAWHADDRRLHFTGFSQGGFMSWRFICKYADTLASVAPAAACGRDPGCELSGTEEIPILYMHGTTDAMVGFSCSEGRRDSAIDAFELSDELVLSEDDGHVWTRHSNARGTVLEFIEHDYSSLNPILGGHCYPGSEDAGGEQGQLFGFKCDDAEMAFHWGRAAIDFFEAHPRPSR